MSPMGQVAGLLARWQHVRAAMEGLDAIMKLPVERPADRHFVRASEIKGQYRLENVTYRHDAAAPPVVSSAMNNTSASVPIMTKPQRAHNHVLAFAQKRLSSTFKPVASSTMGLSKNMK